MERAYYIVESGAIKEMALEIQNKIDAHKLEDKKRVDEFAEEFGCSKEYYTSFNQISGLVFEKPPDNLIWKSVKGSYHRYMPKQNTKEGRALYKRLVGGKFGLDINNVCNNAYPKESCFSWKISKGHAHFVTCCVLPFHFVGDEDIVVISIPFNKMESSAPNIPEYILTHLRPIKAHEYKKMIDEYNEKIEASKK